MEEVKPFVVPACKKVQIFKWLVKKHNCTADFDYGYYWKDSKTKSQKIWFATPKLFRNGRNLILYVASEEYPATILSVSLPSKHAVLSYADVLDALLDKIKKVGGDCFIGYDLKTEVFLPKDTTLEKLCIEFDLAWRDSARHFL